MNPLTSAKYVMNGSKGKLYFDGEYLAGVVSFNAKVTYNKETVFIDESIMEDQKIISGRGTGSVELEKVSSFMQQKVGEKLQRGQDVRFIMRSELDDPDAHGAENVEITNISFDEITIANWQKGTKTTETYPFTFTNWKYLDFAEETAE